MKVRSDFVTNSSSSSFIISQKNDSLISVEAIYSLVRGIYLEFFSNRDKIVSDYASEGIIKLREDGLCFVLSTGESLYMSELDRVEEIREEVRAKYCIDIFDDYFSISPWLGCETYKEYEEFYIELLKSGSKNHAPFTIVDNESTVPVKLLHRGLEYDYDNDCYTDELHSFIPSEENVDTSEELGWYLSCTYDMGKGNEITVDRKKMLCKYCGASDSLCSRFRDYLKDNDVCNLRNTFLGRYCIKSESGYIPYSIVEQLGKLSEVWCDHMG